MNRSSPCPPLASTSSEESADARKKRGYLVSNDSMMALTQNPFPNGTPMSVGEIMADDSESPYSTLAGAGGLPVKTFPEVLKEILSEPSNADSVAWLPHGTAFVVLNRTKFVEEVLPRYLGKATKYTSFTRKLSRWNFARVPAGVDEGAWFNKEFFREDTVEKVREMKCSKRKKAATIAKSMNTYPKHRNSMPLKKRPVDEALFDNNDRAELRRARTPSPVLVQRQQPSIYDRLGSNSAFINNNSTSNNSLGVGGRPLGISDTRSVVQAAMMALAQSNNSGATSATPGGAANLTLAPGSYPLLNPSTNLNTLASLLRQTNPSLESTLSKNQR